MRKIQICGPGCANCERAAAVVREVVDGLAVQAEIEKVTDFAAMARLGVLSTPAVVVDGEVRCVGKVPSRAEVESWLGGAR